MDFPATAGYAVLDLETTGFSPRTERVVEVAVVHVSPGGERTAEWSTLVHPGRTTVGATHVHGIRPADVRDAPRFADVASALVDVLAGRVLVAHNASFDVPFLRAELDRAGIDMPEVAQLCTMQQSRLHLPHLLKRKLADCCAAAGVTLTGAHSALGDARATADLLACYLRTGGADLHALHTALLRQATTTAWPAVAPPSGAGVLRQRATSAPRLVPSSSRATTAAPPSITLRPGDAVVFTGGDPDLRDALELQARRRGLRVTSAVSGRTRVLVTDDVRSGTRKATRALQLGTPVVDLATATDLVLRLPVDPTADAVDLRDPSAAGSSSPWRSRWTTTR